LKNGGWAHKTLSGDLTSVQPLAVKARPIAGTAQNFASLIKTWQSQRNGELEPYAATLGVDRQALVDLGACYAKEYRAFAFPMCLPSSEVVGIRLRSDDRKWAVKGSHAGLFIPFNRISKKLLICEGPTDTAAGLTLGYFAVGRPACLGCEQMIAELIREACLSEAIIVCDNDAPGIRGAEKLAQALQCRTVCVVPPTKDLRAFVSAGGTAQLLESLTESCVRTHAAKQARWVQ